MVKRQPRDSILKKNLHNENQSTMKTQTDIGENPPKSDGVDEMEDVSRTRVWDIPRTGIRSGGRLMEIVKQRADKWVIGYLRQRVYAGIVSGIFHGGEPYSRLTEHTVYPPKAIPRRVTSNTVNYPVKVNPH